MTLRIFLEHIERTKQLPQGDLFCFSSRTYPMLFFYYLLSFLRKHNNVIESINCVDVDTTSIKSLLSMMTFSGATTYYLEHFSTLPIKKQQEMLDYIRAYSGPHRIMFFVDNELLHGKALKDAALPAMDIALPIDMAPRDFFLMRFLVHDNVQDKSAFASELIMRTDQLSLDNACLFAQYEILIGKSVEDFFSGWMIHLVEPTTSLFVLSQHFFSKKPKQFLRQWSAMSHLYLPTFWAAFWADQFWRAYIYADLMKQKKPVEAKKAQYKLPFSFINRDWSMYCLDELRNAHHFLSTLDFQLKNGSSDIGFDYFYAQFFDHKFLTPSPVPFDGDPPIRT